MKKVFALFSLLALASVLALADGTNTWLQSKFEDFEKGTAKGVAISNDGALVLAPELKSLFVSPSTYIWAIAVDGGDNVYAASGSPARVYRVTREGKASIIFQPKELQVQSVVVDSDGAIYAATSPDGKVYKIQKGRGPANAVLTPVTAAGSPASAGGSVKETGTAVPPTNVANAVPAPVITPVPPARAAQGAKETGTAVPPPSVVVDSSYSESVFFEPKTKYIWALALDSRHNLYVATGDHGEIFKVTKAGVPAKFFKSDETHIRTLAVDGEDNLIAGSDGSGLIYRISPSGDGFVLYSAARKEITALQIDNHGRIYAAGVGDKRGATPGPGMGSTSAMPLGSLTILSNLSGAITPAPQISAGSGSEVYVIEPDGSPRRIWTSREELIYALASGHGPLLVGTGNRGRIYTVDGDRSFTDLAKASAAQVTAFAGGKSGMFVATSNLGKIFKLQETAAAEGSFESDVFDGRMFSRWGKLEVRGSGNFEIYVRSGNVENPDRNWSPWKKVEAASAAAMPAPQARFLQWKAVLHPGTAEARIESVTAYYRSKNVAPVVEDLTVQAGARFTPTTKPNNETVMVGGNPTATFPALQIATPLAAQRDRQSTALRWNAHDDNDDDLFYSVYYRGDGETRWKLLKDKITDKFYSWDSSLLPDGGYAVKVVASDAPSHSPQDLLTGEKESARFEVDNTPPRIEGLSAASAGDHLHILFRAIDSFSALKRAEYSIDAGDWQFVEPVGLVSDSAAESYEFDARLPRLAPDAAAGAGNQREHLVVVRVFDRFDNIAAAKIIVR